MSDVPPTSRETIDREHLKLLAIFHYVVGGCHALFSCILIIHFLLGLFMAIAPHAFADGRGQGPPTVIGLLMSAISGCLMLAGWLIGGLTIYSGWCIRRQKHRTFSLIIAVVNSLSIPLGTAMAVFAFIVLTRPSVVQLYVEQGARPSESLRPVTLP